MSSRRRWWWGVLALLLGLLVLNFLGPAAGIAEPDRNAVAARASMASAMDAAASSAANPWGMASRAGAEADQAEAARAAEKAWLLDPKHDAQWCEYGAPKVRAANEIRYQQGGQSAPASVATEALNETTAEILHRWLARLVNRGDVASLAMRDYLLGWLSDSEEAQTAQGRLLKAGLASDDGFVLWLAAGHSCDTRATSTNCDAILNRWMQIEPGNWLSLQWRVDGLPATAGPAVLEHLMAQLAAAEPDPQYVQRYFSLLDSMQSGEAATPGLQRAAELISQTRIAHALTLPRQFRLAEACGSSAGKQLRQHCTEIAKKMVAQWSGLLHYRIAVQLLSDDSALSARHREEAEAMRAWMKRSMPDRYEEDSALAAGDCKSLASGREQLRRFTQLGEPRAYLERMRAEGVDIPALAAEHRARLKRELQER